MSQEITIRRVLTDRQFQIAKELLATDYGQDDLFAVVIAIMAASINLNAPDHAKAISRASLFYEQLLALIESGRSGQHLLYQSPKVIALRGRE